jgi:hypothetical protein
MQALSKFWSGLSSRLLLLLLVWIGLVSLTACSGTPLSLLTGGGPNVAANTQLGQENTQTLGMSDSVDQTVEAETVTGDVKQTKVDAKVEARDVDKVVVNEIDPLLFGTLIFAFILWSYFLYQLPSPDQIWRK